MGSRCTAISNSPSGVRSTEKKHITKFITCVRFRDKVTVRNYSGCFCVNRVDKDSYILPKFIPNSKIKTLNQSQGLGS